MNTGVSAQKFKPSVLITSLEINPKNNILKPLFASYINRFARGVRVHYECADGPRRFLVFCMRNCFGVMFLYFRKVLIIWLQSANPAAWLM